MDTLKPITIWYRKNEKSNCFEHNHIEDGHVTSDKPTSTFPNQVKAWEKGDWQSELAHLNENNVIVKAVEQAINS